MCLDCRDYRQLFLFSARCTFSNTIYIFTVDILFEEPTPTIGEYIYFC